MFNIGQFFSKIKGKQGKEALIRQVMCDAIKKRSGVDVSPNSIEFKASVPVIQGLTSAQKSSIFIHKVSILSDVNMQQSIRRIDDIR